MTEPRLPDVAPSSAGRIRAAGFAILVLFAALLAWEPAFLSRLQAAGFDTLQTITPRKEKSQAALIVEIDEKSIATLGQWPWPRTILARLVRNIARAGPAAIGVDVMMPEPDRLSPARALEQALVTDPALVARIKSLPSNDTVLADAMTGKPVVLAIVGTAEPTGTTLRVAPILRHGIDADGAPASDVWAARYEGVIGNVEEIDRAAAGRGLVSTAETGAVIRRMPLVFDVNGTLAPAFAVDMIRVAEHMPMLRVIVDRVGMRGVEVGTRALPTDRDGALRVYFAQRDADRYVSALDVYNGTVDAARFSNRFVLIGATAVGLAEPQGTPLGVPMPAVEIQAQVIENLLDRTWLQRPASARVLEIALFAALGGLLLWVTPRSPRSAAVVAIACVVVPVAVAYGAFRADRWLFDAVAPGILLLLLFILLLFLTLREATRHRKSLEQVLQRSREDAARVAGEFAAAQRIQTGLLPSPALLDRETRVELAASMTPAREVGGDLYDFFRLDNSRLFFIVGDVAGKGLSASIFMAVSKALCKSVALRQSEDGDVGALVAAVNVEVSRDNPETLFVTAFAAVLDMDTGELAYCNAGHENPYLLGAGGGAPVRITDGDGPPLCAAEHFPYRGAERRLARGDVLCIVSDGVGEAHNPAGEFYGTARIGETLARLAAKGMSASALAEGLRRDVAAFTAGGEPADDITVLTLKWNGAR